MQTLPLVITQVAPSCPLLWPAVSSGPTDLPKTPLPSHVLKTPGSVFLRSSMGTLHSPLTAPFTPDLDSPFSSPSIRRLTAPQEPGSPWFGSVQSPHVMRRGPKLWSASTGKLQPVKSHSFFAILENAFVEHIWE